MIHDKQLKNLVVESDECDNGAAASGGTDVSSSTSPKSSQVGTVHRLVAAGVLLLVMPLMIIIAASILATGQDPIFRQWRVGYRCRPFRILKFRTIWAGEEPLDGVHAVRRLQRRVFDQVSRALRATGLDELPQFVNILKGDMALIGPRPLIPDEYDRLPAGRDIRASVLPGITGLAQVNGGQRLSDTHKLVFDIYYVQRKSSALDLYIVGRTALRIIGMNHVTDRTNATILFLAVQHVAGNRTAEDYAVVPSRNPRSTR